MHIYHHVLFEGLGLRQVMDYYFSLTASSELSQISREFIVNSICSFGMGKFANGIMWIMKKVFALEDESLICKADESVGRLLLDEIMQGGNFGQYDEKIKGLHGGTAIGRSLCGLKRNMKFFMLGPWEVLSSPLWSLWHWWWRKRKGII